MIRQVGQPDHFRMFRENSNRPEAKLVGGLQEVVELQDSALDRHERLSNDPAGLLSSCEEALALAGPERFMPEPRRL